MAVRTTSGLVQGVLLSNYGAKSDGALPSLTPFIHIANLLTTRVAACAVAKGVPRTADELIELETWLAAHFYTRSDTALASESTERASGAYQGKTGMHLQASFYGQTAMDLDTSGCLAGLNSQKRASMTWMGKVPSEEIPYDWRS